LANKVEEYNEEEVNETVMFMEGIWGVLNRNRAEEAIASLNLKNELILNSAAEGILGLDLQGNHTFVNPAAARMLGYEFEELLGRPGHSCWHHSRPDGSPFPKEDCPILITGLNGVEHHDFNALFWRKDGTGFPVEYVSTPILEQGQVTGVVVTFSDISEHKQAEEKIRASLQEKEVLLQEIHHRVKNNLQIISGLLTLQSDQAAGKSLNEIFRTSQDRIRSMALIHEKLYYSHNLAEIAFDEYLRTLVESLFAAHSVEAGRITARYEMESIFFHIEKAMPLGLIANELVANALKHAFPAGRQGEIRITLQERTGTPPFGDKSRRAPTDHGCAPTYELIIADNGIGLPSGFEADKQKSLGMHLVSMLAKQIQAELKVTSGPGAEFRLLFSGLPTAANASDKYPQGDF
jgi:PAS domain S-box-containing protein